MIKKHWTIHYVISKLKYKLRFPKYKEAPWFTFEAIDYLTEKIKPTDLVFEWGGGRSSIWFAKRCKQITTVDHNQTWFSALESRVKNENIPNLDLILAKDDTSYENAIERFGDESLDIIIIDGIRRDFCAEKAFPRLKKGGMIVLDNVERYLPSKSRSPLAQRTWDANPSKLWISLRPAVEACELIWFENGVTDTAILIKK